MKIGTKVLMPNNSRGEVVARSESDNTSLVRRDQAGTTSLEWINDKAVVDGHFRSMDLAWVQFISTHNPRRAGFFMDDSRPSGHRLRSGGRIVGLVAELNQYAGRDRPDKYYIKESAYPHVREFSYMTFDEIAIALEADRDLIEFD